MTAIVLSLLLLYAEPSMGRRSKAVMRQWFWVSALLGVVIFYAPRHAPALLMNTRFVGWAALETFMAAVGLTGIIRATADLLHLDYKTGFLIAALPYAVLTLLPYPLIAHLFMSLAAGHGIVTLGSLARS